MADAVLRAPPQEAQMANKSAQRWPTPSQAALLLLGLALRPLLALAAPGLIAWLEARPELSTPLTSVEALREGVFLRSKGLNPYESGSFHINPLYLNLFGLLPLDGLVPALLWTGADACAAWALRSIYETRPGWVRAKRGATNRGREAGGENARGEDWGWTVMILYLLNPYTLLTSLARSTVALDNALLLGAIAGACQGQALWSLYLLAIATTTQLYPILLLPPLILLLLRGTDVLPAKTTTDTQARPRWNKAVAAEVARLVVWYAACLGGTLGIAWAYVGDGRFLPATWGAMLTLSDLTPNVGMWWYFFTEMFEHFRVFFLGVFQMHVMIYVAPLCIRLRSQPLLATTIIAGIISTFKSYPALGDAALWIGLIKCFPELWSDLRYPLLATCIHLYTLILLPLLHDLWLVAGTGNANFFYAATLVYNLGCGMAIVDLLGAGLRWEVWRKIELRQGGDAARDKNALREKGEEQGEFDGRDPLDGLVVVQYTTL